MEEALKIFHFVTGSLSSHARDRNCCAFTHTHTLCSLGVKLPIQTDTCYLLDFCVHAQGLIFLLKFCFSWRLEEFRVGLSPDGQAHPLRWHITQAEETVRWREGCEVVGGGWGKQCQSHDPSSHIPPQAFVFIILLNHFNSIQEKNLFI